ncbi:MAG: 2,3-diphosphoglycerate synthetase, partial [Actinomycetota bacterium]
LGVAYEGPDFRFTPPPRPRLCERPSVAIIGTGKRTGKTAVAAFTARTLVTEGYKPVIVAMGRGGPPEPGVLRGDEIELEARDLLELADQGKHAASDYVEDALLGRVPTVGCRRCGGGLAGGVQISNVAEGVAMANELSGDLILLEGSGSSIPPVHADASVLVVSSGVDPDYVGGYMGPYRLLLADLVVVTMCEEPFGSPSAISAITSRVGDAFRLRDGDEEGREIRVIRTVFRPAPVRSVDGARAFVATTAPEGARRAITHHLEAEHGCEVVGITHSLSDRQRLEKELKDIKDRADVLLCEIKAAGVDVATRTAMDVGLDVVYMDNVPVARGDDDLASALADTARRAGERFKADHA